MIHPIEHVAAGVVVLCLGAFVWLSGPPTPKPKPEEFVTPPAEFVEPASQEQTATIRMQPTPVEPLTEKEKLQDVTQQLQAVQQRASRIEKLLDEKGEKK